MTVRYLMIPESAAVSLREQVARLAQMRELIDTTLDLCNSLLANSGHAELPGGPTAPSQAASPARLPVRIAADTALPAPTVDEIGEEEEEEEGGDEGSRRYVIARGNWGVNYADVVDWEVEPEIFSLEQAWRIIRPLIKAKPESWRRALRRSLENDKKNRFVKLDDIGTMWGRTRPRSVALEERSPLFLNNESAEHPRANADSADSES